MIPMAPGGQLIEHTFVEAKVAIVQLKFHCARSENKAYKQGGQPTQPAVGETLDRSFSKRLIQHGLPFARMVNLRYTLAHRIGLCS